jgi:hypothetical protein
MDLMGAVNAIFTATAGLLGSIVNLDKTGHYVHWHFINISVANLVVIGLMILVFLAAILLPFPRHGSSKGGDHD